MNLLVQRMWPTEKSTIGSLFVDGIFCCYTLEDVDRFVEKGNIKIPKETAIPRGRYKVVVDWSQRFKRPMPHVLDVPQFTGIRFHILNMAEETEGCIGLGMERNTDRLYHSADAFSSFFEKLFNVWANQVEIWLEVK